MKDIKLFVYFMIGGVFSSLVFIFFFVLLCCSSSSDSVIVVADSNFSIPFESQNVFAITSNFGYRLDPLGSGETKFHTGIDLGSSCGTDVLASMNGVVYEVGYKEVGLGNYIYIKHQTKNELLFTTYGHLLDESIIVEKDEPVIKGQKIAQVGTTGSSTGCHLHFSIMKNKISLNEEDLIDPYFVINGLN